MVGKIEGERLVGKKPRSTKKMTDMIHLDFLISFNDQFSMYSLMTFLITKKSAKRMIFT
jgi:hypothetical protein